MKKKHLAIILLVIGILLLCLSAVLTAISMSNISIIGGADWPTFKFLFFEENKTLVFFGILSLVVSVIVWLRKTKQ